MSVLARAGDSALVVIDVQPAFLKAIPEGGAVLARTLFLVRMARLLGIPVLATEQYASRMGGSCSDLVEAWGDAPVFDKMTFSCCGSEGFVKTLRGTGARQAVLAGIETHICVNQTAHHLLEADYDVILAEDAISCRTAEAHRNGVERMRADGATVAHSESIAYEWLGSADHPRFREALELVKAFPPR
jgi:nicotinamidase-related amidase